MQIKLLLIIMLSAACPIFAMMERLDNAQRNCELCLLTCREACEQENCLANGFSACASSCYISITCLNICSPPTHSSSLTRHHLANILSSCARQMQ